MASNSKELDQSIEALASGDLDVKAAWTLVRQVIQKKSRPADSIYDALRKMRLGD
jgi:hypothetical protein